MASASKDLQAAIVARLKASETFLNGVGERIFGADPREVPCAWVGATQSESASDTAELLATVHIWQSGEQSAVAKLIRDAQAALRKAPSIEGWSIGDWRCEYSETRFDTERAAYRAVVRFRAKTVANMTIRG